jgi:hypothetical protein
MALSNVRVIDNCAVHELIADDIRAAIKGVRVRIGNGDEHRITADLVVDASGRGSSSPAWLESFGFPKPEEERIEIGIGYTTRHYRRRPTDLDGKLAVVVAGSGPNWRNGVVLYQAEDRWIVSIGGYFGDHAPDDDQLFAAYAGSLPTSDIYDIVAHAEPLGDFVRYRYPANLRRRYERLAEFPKGYLVLGDALCSFNPVYGQGMTVAAQQAMLLRECLDAGAADLARRFFARAADVIDTPWDIAVGNDLRHPKVEGPRPAESALHQLVYRQAAHGRALRRRAGDRLSRGRQSGGAADTAVATGGRDARDPGHSWPPQRRPGGCASGGKPEWILLAQIVAVGFRDDLPAVTQFHRHQIVGEIARRQLAAHLDEGGLIVGAVDGDDEILARLAFGLG